MIKYLEENCNGHLLEAGFETKNDRNSVVCIDSKPLKGLPKDYVCGLKLYKSDLYIVYQRAVLRVSNVVSGNDLPDDGYALSMLDYYSYEKPQLCDYKGEKLYASIGGRFFVLDENSLKWKELQSFFIGDSFEKTPDDKIFVFSTNLLFDNNLFGVKLFYPESGELKFFPLDQKYGKSPNALVYVRLFC